MEIDRLLKRVEGGAVLQGQNALPHIVGRTVNLTAKSAIENCRAGRAAKGATLGLTQSCSLRSGTLTPTYRRSLISPLKSIVNAFLNGQLVPSSTATPSRCNSTRKSKNSTLALQGCYFWCTRWRIAETPQAEASRQSVVAYKVSSSREPWALPNPAGTKMPPQKGGVWCTRWGSSHAR